MSKILKEFLENKTTLKQLKKQYGENLYNCEIKNPEKVYAKNVIFLIEQYICGKTSTKELLDWVNVVWFTDLFEYNLAEEDAIASVMSALETLDEDDKSFSSEDFLEMIKALSDNKMYKNY